MSVVTATIKSKGKTLPQKYELLSIEVHREVNRIPFAELVLLDGNAAKQEFELSDENLFEPGQEIEIHLRYEGQKGGSKKIFKGVVVRHNLEAGPIEATLSIEVRDKAFGMAQGRNSAIFEKKTDRDIIKDLISKGGASPGKIPSTNPKHEVIVQYYCSNWDFMLLRAQANNLLVTVTDGEVGLHELKIGASAKHKYEYGISEIYSFEMEADASHQYESVASVAWNIKTQKLSKKSKAKDLSLKQSNLNGASIAKKVGGPDYLLYSNVPLDPKEASTWANSTLARSRMSLLRGVISVPGFASVKLMDVMELNGIGKRFNGKTLVTGIRHTVNQDGWQTHLQFGISAEAFAVKDGIAAPAAAGLLPPVQGLQIGVVDKFEKDETQKQFRVRVNVPGLDTKKGKIWARLVSPDAGKERGWFFRPEMGDEVVLGFLNDDPRQAIILGSLYSSKNSPPKAWANFDDKNILKGIISKTGITLEINDKEQTFKFLTSEKQSILMDEKKKLITITDVNKNNITLNEDGIEVKDLSDNSVTMSKDGITIKIADKLTIEASGDVGIKAGGDLELKGSNVTLNASSKVAIKGSAVDVK